MNKGLVLIPKRYSYNKDNISQQEVIQVEL